MKNTIFTDPVYRLDKVLEGLFETTSVQGFSAQNEPLGLWQERLLIVGSPLGRLRSKWHYVPLEPVCLSVHPLTPCLCTSPDPDARLSDPPSLDGGLGWEEGPLLFARTLECSLPETAEAAHAQLTCVFNRAFGPDGQQRLFLAHGLARCALLRQYPNQPVVEKTLRLNQHPDIQALLEGVVWCDAAGHVRGTLAERFFKVQPAPASHHARFVWLRQLQDVADALDRRDLRALLCF